MKKTLYSTLITILLASSAFTILEKINWKIKEEACSVKFSGNKVEGTFKGLKSTIFFDEDNLSASTINATIEAATVNTGNGMKNRHLLEMIDAKQFPTIKFESTSISKNGLTYEALGKLTLSGVTKEITLPFAFEKKGEEGFFTGKFKVILKDFSITKSGAPDEVEVVLTVPVKK